MGWLASDNINIVPTDANLTCDSYATWTASAGSQENLPINCVNWYEAYAFCIWDGGFLPSEAEWEYAAAGGDQQREYPWGSADPGTGSQYAIYDCDYPAAARGTCSGRVNIAPVGTARIGAGLWGHFDLAGNVFEWNLDVSAPYVDPCTDCAYLAATSYRVIRGGSSSDPSSDLLPPYRNYGDSPAGRNGSYGVRCARVP
jgi:formylglycine-generating enzyme required for sulfatase activity